MKSNTRKHIQSHGIYEKSFHVKRKQWLWFSSNITLITNFREARHRYICRFVNEIKQTNPGSVLYALINVVIRLALLLLWYQSKTRGRVLVVNVLRLSAKREQRKTNSIHKSSHANITDISSTHKINRKYNDCWHIFSVNQITTMAWHYHLANISRYLRHVRKLSAVLSLPFLRFFSLTFLYSIFFSFATQKQFSSSVTAVCLSVCYFHALSSQYASRVVEFFSFFFLLCMNQEK